MKAKWPRPVGILVAATLTLCAAGLWGAAQDTAGDVRQIILTWQSDPQTTMTITWRTDAEGERSTAYYSAAAGLPLEEYDSLEAETFTFAETAAWLHSVELTSLAPGQTYWVVLETDTSRSEPFSFRTAPGESDDVVFVMGADAQDLRSQMPVIREMLARAVTDDPDFFVYSGDFVNAELSDLEWDLFFDVWDELMITPEGRRIPLVPAVGNHEVVGGYGGGDDQTAFYLHRFRLPEPQAYYALQYGPDLTILSLNSNHSAPIDGDQLSWLEQTLEDHQDSPWIVAHYHDGAWWGSEPMGAKIRVYWVPLFERYGVDLVHSGHTHTYRKIGPASGVAATADEALRITDEGLARAQEDYEPSKNYAPPLQRNLLKLTRGDWQGAGFPSLVEGLEEMAYMLALYVIQTGEPTRERLYDQVCSTQLYKDYWAPILADVGAGALTDEQAGVLYLVNGSLGASEEGPYEYTRVTLHGATNQMTVVNVFYYAAEGRWEEEEALTRTAP